MKKRISISILALVALMGLLSFITQSTQLYEVRVNIKNGHCSRTQTYTVEAKSQSEARNKAIRTAINSTKVSVMGTSVRR